MPTTVRSSPHNTPNIFNSNRRIDKRGSCTHTYTHTYTYTDIHTHTCTHAHTHRHTHTHVHTHTYTHKSEDIYYILYTTIHPSFSYNQQSLPYSIHNNPPIPQPHSTVPTLFHTQQSSKVMLHPPPPLDILTPSPHTYQQSQVTWFIVEQHYSIGHIGSGRGVVHQE